SLMREEAVIENNELLLTRINAAANHFEPQFEGLLSDVQNHPLLTEHREVSAVVNESLTQLAISIYTTNYFLRYCKGPFSVTSFLQHKLQFSVPRIIVSCYAGGKKQSFSDGPNPELYDTLKRWRDMICEESGSPIYMVANHASLLEIATYLPLTKKDLVKIAGFGKAKADKYGGDILETVEDYCSRMGLETNMSQK